MADKDHLYDLTIKGKMTALETGSVIGKPGTYGSLSVGAGNLYTQDENGVEICEFWAYDASAASGSRFSRFTSNAGTQTIANGDAVYIGSKFEFSAWFSTISTLMNEGANDATYEFYNGTAWVGMEIAVYEAATLAHRGNTGFSGIESQLVEHSVRVYDTWAAANNVLDSVPSSDAAIPMFWIRIINVGALTTGAVFTGGAVTGDGFDVHASTKTVFWGRNRLAERVTREQGLFNTETNPPSNADIDLSTNIVIKGDKNSFTANALDKLNLVSVIPLWADTSTPVLIHVDGYGTVDSTDDIEFEAIWVTYAVGDDINSGGLSEFDAQTVVAYNGTADDMQSIEIVMPIDNFFPGDELSITIFRDGQVGNGDDTYGGAFVMLDMELNFTRKSIG